MILYKITTGSFDINQKWFEQGSGLKKLTMITDYIDTAAVTN